MNPQVQLITVFCLLSGFFVAVHSITSTEVKCHVCKATVQEMEEAIAEIDPNKKADVSGFRLDAAGNAISKSVPLAKSEIFLTELMENICDKMDDYLKATYKNNGKFTLLKMLVDGKMNPESSNVDFVQDGDLNKSLKHFCLEILEDHEEAFLTGFQANTIDKNLDVTICTEIGKYCNDVREQDEYEYEEKDEL